jgi:hypothetical protein
VKNFNFYVSQGSVATPQSCDGMITVNQVVGNGVLFTAVEEFNKPV